MVVFKYVTKKDVARLLKKGFTMAAPKTMHEELRLEKKGVIAILYTSKKLLLQGKREAVENIAGEIDRLHIGEMVKKESFRKQEGWVIGSDESLKGDTFGGIVVAAVKANDKVREQLLELGVGDSKKLSDAEIIPMAQRIRKIAPCEIRSLLPEEYNSHKGNTTELLNKLHHNVASDLSPGTHVVDKYPGCNVGEVQEERAESKFVEVAAASVLARAAALQQIDVLSSQIGFPLPKGSTHVQEALLDLKKKGANPKRFAKLHFRNVREAFKR